MNKTAADKQSATEMISANEARKITDSVNFKNSGFASLIASTIRDAAGKGESQAAMLIPENVAEEAAKFLEQNGFRVVMGHMMTGALVTAAW